MIESWRERTHNDNRRSEASLGCVFDTNGTFAVHSFLNRHQYLISIIKPSLERWKEKGRERERERKREKTERGRRERGRREKGRRERERERGRREREGGERERERGRVDTLHNKSIKTKQSCNFQGTIWTLLCKTPKNRHKKADDIKIKVSKDSHLSKTSWETIRWTPCKRLLLLASFPSRV